MVHDLSLRYEDVDALTVAYCVDNEDGTRTELNRVTLERVLMQLLENDPPACMKRRTRVTAAKLRDLAEKTEKIVRIHQGRMIHHWSHRPDSCAGLGPIGELDDGAPSKWELAA